MKGIVAKTMPKTKNTEDMLIYTLKNRKIQLKTTVIVKEVPPEQNSIHSVRRNFFCDGCGVPTWLAGENYDQASPEDGDAYFVFCGDCFEESAASKEVLK